MKRKWIAAASSLVLGCSAIAMPFSGAVTVQAADSRSGFVTTNGTQFMLDGSTFYYAGTNNYYINFKPKATVDAALEDAAAMGMKVVRTWGNLDAGVKTDKVSGRRKAADYIHQQLGSVRRHGTVCKVGAAGRRECHRTR